MEGKAMLTGAGLPKVTQGERTLLSAWLKHGRDWLMFHSGKARLLARLGLTDVHPPKFENNFEADFSRGKVCDVFGSRSLLGKSLTLTLEKSHLKSFQTSRKKSLCESREKANKKIHM